MSQTVWPFQVIYNGKKNNKVVKGNVLKSQTSFVIKLKDLTKVKSLYRLIQIRLVPIFYIHFNLPSHNTNGHFTEKLKTLCVVGKHTSVLQDLLSF